MIKRWLTPVLLVTISLILVLLVCEITLRVIGISNTVFYVPDNVTGFGLRPNAEGWWTKEGRSYVRINSAGLRDIEHTLEKPSNTYRIAVVGDSYAEALQVSLDDAFWKVMEGELNRCRGTSRRVVEVINFGVSAYGTAQELLTLRSKVRKYSPDLVLLAFATGNDVRNNIYGLELDPLRPYFIRQGSSLQLDDSFRRTFLFSLARFVSPLMEDWRLMQLADIARIRIKHALVRQAHKKPIAETVGAEPGLDSTIYFEPRESLWAEAWTITEMLLEQFQVEVAGMDAKFLVVSLSNGIQVHPDNLVRERFMRRLNVSNLNYPETRLTGISRRVGFQLLTLAPRLHVIAQTKKSYLHGFGDQRGFGHWNEAGHRYAGELIANQICQNKVQFGAR